MLCSNFEVLKRRVYIKIWVGQWGWSVSLHAYFCTTYHILPSKSTSSLLWKYVNFYYSSRSEYPFLQNCFLLQKCVGEFFVTYFESIWLPVQSKRFPEFRTVMPWSFAANFSFQFRNELYRTSSRAKGESVQLPYSERLVECGLL